MIRKTIVFIIILCLSVVIISCDGHITTEKYNDEILLKNEIVIDNIDDNIFYNFVSSESYSAFMSRTNNGIYIKVYDNDSKELLYSQEELFEDFMIRGFDISNEYLVYIGVDQESEAYVVKAYSLIDDKLSFITVDNNINLIVYENPIQIVNEKILVNLITSYRGEGFTYLIDIDNLNEPIIVASYDINHIIMDATFEAVYGGANKIVYNQIVMSIYNYVDTHNRVDLYNIDDASFIRSLTASDSEDMTCNILNAQIVDSYISLKAICTNDIQKFIVYNTQDESYKLSIEIPYAIDDYKIKGINNDYVLLTDGNHNRDNSKLLIYNIELDVLKEIETPLEETEFFGAISYLFNQRVAIINDQKLYVYDLVGEEYLIIEEVNINRIYGLYNQFIVFESIIDGEKQIWSYNMIDNEFDFVLDVNSELYDLIIEDNHILILEETTEYTLYILE